MLKSLETYISGQPSLFTSPIVALLDKPKERTPAISVTFVNVLPSFLYNLSVSTSVVFCILNW